MKRLAYSAVVASATKAGYVLLAGSAILAFAFMPMALADPTNRYVIKDNPGAAEPYDSPANAAADIQTAVNYAYAGETVLVSAATYDAGGVAGYPAGTLLTNRVAITKAITVRSADNDPTNTIIKGNWDPATNGPTAVRCVYMVNNSSLIGFTLTNGATLTNYIAPKYDDVYGGGVWCQSTNTVISNCVITGNAAQGLSGGAYQGTLYNCTLIGNSATYDCGGAAKSILYNCTLTGNSGRNGGGAYVSTLSNCTLIGNSAGSVTAGGGGAYLCTLYNCTLTGNSAAGVTAGGGGAHSSTLYDCTIGCNTGSYGGGVNACKVYNCTITNNSGGGAYDNCTLSNCTIAGNWATYGGGVGKYCTLSNCTIVSNQSTRDGGGAWKSTLYNCLLVGNEQKGASWAGGGAYACTQYNCTVVGNQALYGGGVCSGTLYNCIVYFNNATNPASTGANWYGAVSFTNCCTTPDQGGWAPGNITNDPKFIANGSGYGTNHVMGNYRLSPNSPCINAGTNQDWMTNSVDLDGYPRIRYGTVDMGAYEKKIYRGTTFSFR